MHTLWLIITCTALLWYSTITVYVAVKGFKDIKTMLKNLENQNIANTIS